MFGLSPDLPEGVFSGKRLAQLRRARGMTQGQLAASAGIAQAHVSHFECDRREPRPENLVKLARALRTTTDCLLNYSAPAPEET